MDLFYFIVPSIAICILILILAYVGIRMTYYNNVPFPPQYSSCPDYWTVTNQGYCVVPQPTHRNYGGLDTIKNWNASIPAGSFNHPEVGAIDFSKSRICDLKKWANTYSIYWDGVSNFNRC